MNKPAAFAIAAILAVAMNSMIWTVAGWYNIDPKSYRPPAFILAVALFGSLFLAVHVYQLLIRKG